VVRTIVTSPEFFAAAAYRAKVKSPFELVTSALRAVGAAPDASPRTAQVIARLGQPLFGHQAPNGWPETGAPWINTGAILNRINFGLALAGGALPGASLDRWPPARALAGAPREQQVDAVARTILGGAISADTRQLLLAGENPLLARRGAPDATRDDSTMRAEPEPVDPAMGPPRGRDPLTSGRARPLDGLPLIVGLALGSPEFQRR